MADGDVQQPDCDLWHAVRKLLPANAGWPSDSETLAEHQSGQWTKAKDVFNASMDIVDSAAAKIHPPGGAGGTWPDPAGGFMQRVIAKANGKEGFRQIADAMQGMAAEYQYYGAILRSTKTSIKDYVEDLSWQYTAMGFGVPSQAKRNQEDFARGVASNVLKIVEEHAGWLKDPDTRPQAEDPSNNVFSGLWKSAKDQVKALAGLFGRGEDGSWSVFNAQVAWGHMDKLVAGLALYSLPGGLGMEIDNRLLNGVLGEYLADAGKAFVDYENWDNAPLHALGYTTGMVAGLLGPTRGVGAAVKLAGRGLKAPKVIKFGEGIQKATLTNGVFKSIGKLDDTLKARRIAKGDEFVLHPSVTPEVARLIHDRPPEPPTAGPHGPSTPEPHGPGPTKPPSTQTPHPEVRPEPTPPRDGNPPSHQPTREQHSTPPSGHGERLAGETPRAEPRAPHGDQTPVAKGDGPESLKREPGPSATEPPAARHDPSPETPEPRQPRLHDALDGTPSPTADHAPATRAEGQPSSHGAETAHTRSADTPSGAPGREAPTATPPLHTTVGDSPANAAKRADTGGPERGTPAKPSAEELRRLYENRELARMERKLYEEAQKADGGAVYPDHVVKAWSRHAAHSESIRTGHETPGETTARPRTGLRSGEILHNRGAHPEPETGRPHSNDKNPDGKPSRNDEHGRRDTPEPDRPGPENVRNSPRRLGLDEFARTHFPDEYRKAHGDDGGGPRDESPSGTGTGNPDRPSPGPSGSGGAAQAEAARGGVALETRPPAVEKAPQPAGAPAAAKAQVEAPKPEPRTAQPIPNKPVILHPDGTPEPLRPMTVTPVEIHPDPVTGPGKPVDPAVPSRMNPGWAEPPRFGDPEPPRFGDPEPPRFGDPERPRFGDPEPPRFGDPERPKVGWPVRPVPGELPARPDRAPDPSPPTLPRTFPPAEKPELPALPEVPEVPEIPELPTGPEIRELPTDPEIPVTPEGARITELPTDPEIPVLSKEPEIPEPPREPEIPANPLQAAREKPAPEFRPWDKWYDPRWETPWPQPEGVQEYIDGAIERSAQRAEAEAAWEEWNAAVESAAREDPREAHLDNVAFGIAGDKELTPEEWAKVAAMDDYAPELPELRAKLDQVRASDPERHAGLLELLSDPGLSFDKKLFYATTFLMPAMPSSLPAQIRSAAPAVRDRLERAVADGMMPPEEFQRRMAAWADFVVRADGLRESIDEANRTDDVRPVLDELRAFSEALREYARTHADSAVPAWREVVRFDLLDPHRLRTLRPSVTQEGHFDVVTQAIVAHWFDSIFGAPGLDYATRAAALAVPLDMAALKRRFPGVDIDEVFGDLVRVDNPLDGMFMTETGTGFLRPQLGMADFITTMLHEFAVHGLQDPATVPVGEGAAGLWADLLFRVAHEFQGRSGEILVTEAMRAEAEKSIVPPELRRDISDLPRLSPKARDLHQLEQVIRIESGDLAPAYKAALFQQLMAIGVSHERDLARIRDAVAGGPKIQNPVVEAFEADPHGFTTRYSLPKPPDEPEPPDAPSPGPVDRPTPPGPGMPPSAASPQPDTPTDPSGPVTLGDRPRPGPDVPARQPESGVPVGTRPPSPLPPPGIPFTVWRELSATERLALATLHSRGLNAAGTLAATVAQVRSKTKPTAMRKLPRLLGKMPAGRRAEVEARLTGFTIEGQAPSFPPRYLDRTGDLSGPATLTAADHESLGRVATLDREIGRSWANPWRRRRLLDELSGLLDELGLNPNHRDFAHRAAALENHPVAPVVWRRLGPLDDQHGLPTTSDNLVTQLSGTIIPGTVPSAVFIAMGSVQAGIAYTLTTFLAAVTAGLLTRRHEIGDDAAIAARRKELDALRQYERVFMPTDRLRLHLRRLGLPEDHGPDLAAVKAPKDPSSSGTQKLRHFYLRYGVPPLTGVGVATAPVLDLAASARWGLAIGGGVAAIVAPLLQWKRARAKVNTELRAGERNARALLTEAAHAEDVAYREQVRALSGRPVPGPDAPGPAPEPVDPGLPMSATTTEGVEGLVQIGRRVVPPSEPKLLDPNAAFKVTLYEAMIDYGIAKALLVLPAIPLVSRADKIEMINKVARTAVDKRAKFEAEQAKERELQASQVAALEAARTAAADAVAPRPGLLRRLFGKPPASTAPVPARPAETAPPLSPIPAERPGSVTKTDYKNIQRALAVVGAFGSAATALALGLDVAYAVAALTGVATGGWVGRDKWRHRQVELAARNKKADADAVTGLEDFEHDATALADFLTERLTDPLLSIAEDATRAGRSDVLDLLAKVWEMLTRNVEAGPATAPPPASFDDLGPLPIEGDRWHDPMVRDRALAALEEIRRSAMAERLGLAVHSGDWSTLPKRLGLLAGVLDLAARAVTHLGRIGENGAGPVQTTVATLNDAVHEYQQSGPRYLEPPDHVQAIRANLSEVDSAAARYLDRSAPTWRRPRTADMRAALDAVDAAIHRYRQPSVPGEHSMGEEAAVHKAIDRYESLRGPNRHEPSPPVMRAAVTELRNAIDRHRQETAPGWRWPESATDEVTAALTGLKHAITRHHQLSATHRTNPRAGNVTAALNEIERIIDRYRRESAPKWREPAGQDAKLGQVLGELHWALHHYWLLSAPRGRASTGYDKALKAADKDLKKAVYAVKKLDVAGLKGKPVETAPPPARRALSTGQEVHYAASGMSVGHAAETHKAHLRTMLANRPDPAQPYVVTVHDDGALPSPEELAAATLRSEYYTPGRPVRLHSCRSATWARRFAIALGAPVVAPVADLHVLGRRTELPDGTVLPFGQEVVEGYAIGDGWAEFPPSGKRPVMLRSAAGSRPITLDELNSANPVGLGRPDDFAKLFRSTQLHELSALHAGTARLRPVEVKAYLDEFHPQLDKVNPGYHGEDAAERGYTTNCTRAVVYHERRRLGEDVTAPPLRPEDAALGSLGYVSDRLGGEWDHSHGTSYDSVISAMLDRPVGAMAVIAVDSKTPKGTENKHVALVSRDRHGVVFLDPLDGTLMELPLRPTKISLLPYMDVNTPSGNLHLPEPGRTRVVGEKVVTTSPDGGAVYRSLTELSSDFGYNGHPAYDRYPPSPESGPEDGSALFRATPLHSLPAMDADTVDGRWREAVAFIMEHFPQLPETNPGYYADWAAQLGFHTNCTRSVVYFVRRLLGEDLTAPPVPVELKDDIATLDYVSDNLGGQWTEIDDAGYDGVISAMLARPVGTLAAVNFLYQKDKKTTGSHVALVAHHPGGVVFLDPLTGWLTLLEEIPLQILLLPFPGKRGV
ncbi:toxin glutamine deamidase domain-containing protein [Amycolatopsis sp. NPDC049868]|uniref:toxin glutamine deamidase domain-containing protein n=1 Tax=Amycolatopsis sp. NPDC049868 TaxID=3363934 RepID=UPI003789DC82